MKTEHEAEVISSFCGQLSELMATTSNYCSLKYDNRGEFVKGIVNDRDVHISVNLSSITASARDIIKGIARVLNDKF